MGQLAWKGRNLLTLLASFIPELAKEYSGFLWVCDYCGLSSYDAEGDEEGSLIPSGSYPLDKVTQSIVYKGGGGTRFDGAFAKLGDIERTKQEKNPKYEMCLVFFSDMEIDKKEFETYSKLGPTRQIYVSIESKKDYIPQYIYNRDKTEVILIAAEKENK